MPVYTYHCENCGHQFDRQQNFADDPLKACPKCKKHTLQKVYRPAGLVFKGSGFYVTDKSAKASNGKKAKENGSSETKAEPQKEAKVEKKNGKSQPKAKDD